VCVCIYVKKSNMEVLIKGKTSLNSLVVIGSKIQVDGLEETIAKITHRYKINSSDLRLA